MEALNYKVGTKVTCQGETCGELVGLVVDPHSKRVTDLIVGKGFLLKKDSLVPAEVVEATEEGNLALTIHQDELDSLPEYRDSEYELRGSGENTIVPPPAVSMPGLAPTGNYYYIAGTPPTVPMLRMTVHKGISATKSVIERGDTVWTGKHRLGVVDHVFVDPKTGEIGQIIVNRGLWSHWVIVPANLITTIDDDGIFLKLTADQVGTLRHYQARNGKDVLDELKERLAAIAFDLDSIDATWNGGVISLGGEVATAQTKRAIEATARSLAGVISVNNALTTAEGIRARVMAALRNDPLTEVSGIDVLSGQGIVTLSGQVDSEEIKKQAETLAAAQPGVKTVINDLVVALDEYSPYLSVRLLSLGIMWPEQPAGTMTTLSRN